MSVYLDKKYIDLIKYKLSGFAWKSSKIAWCRCPVCGDSRHNKLKKRFYFFIHKNFYQVKCFNCNYSSKFSFFLKEFDYNLFSQYNFDQFSDTAVEILKEKPKNLDFSTNFSQKKNEITLPKGCQRVSALDDTHICKKYVKNRKIPDKFHEILWYAENFSCLSSILPESSVKIPSDPRLIIPFFSKNGDLKLVQGRSLDSNCSLRYLTLKIDEEYPKIYGLERVDTTKLIFVVEGPIDSLFLSNSIAMTQLSASSNIENYIDITNSIFVLDNEPRKPETVYALKKLIDEKKKVCVWPKNINEKDINDMILSGKNPEKIILENSYSDMAAHLQWYNWKKI